MRKKFNDLSSKTYLACKRFICDLKDFVHNFKEDERGLSGVVVAVLLILVAVLAVTLIWGLLGDWIKDLWDKIINKGEKIAL